MGFYKPGANHTENPKMARFHKLIWSLIFAGLLTIVIGIFVGKTDDVIGWTTIAAGVVMTLTGALLVYVRSRVPTDV